MKKYLVIMRSIPGAGKSTLAKKIRDKAEQKGLSANIFSTDDFHMEGDKYVFKADKLGQFHQKNFIRTFDGLARDNLDVVIVDNTNTTRKEYLKYVLIGLANNYNIVVAYPNTDWAFDVEECTVKNTHQVPKEAIQKMLDRFENPLNCYHTINRLCLDHTNSKFIQTFDENFLDI